MIKVNKIIQISFLGIIFLFGCNKENLISKRIITIRGSDTMVNLTQRWAEEYMKIRPDISIHVTGGGSGTGIASLLNGTADIANISRELKGNEIEKAIKLGIMPKQTSVAMDGIALIVNPENIIDTLSIEDLKNIFSGKITNWKDFGGADSKILLYGRENSSGTYELFKQVVLGKKEGGRSLDFTSSMQALQGTSSLGEAVSNDPNGIGFGGVGYFSLRSDLKILFIKNDNSVNAYSPLNENGVNYSIIWNGKYPLTRYLYCYTNGEPDLDVQDFLNYIVSKEGQDIVRNMEYIPLPETF
ncbi:MAG: phosphate ABC transporter substrate-binding protein [Melioribacteraceae bacterium]|nr:phosphate ABC transporter substrate-binding protein [Melioribacteraceae bacterium]MCF8263259.1 phosphate ABC transporter substrate-binding protein [Melioribacteraceae bacterium]MCF8412870.1 phosphate ABC transporter substrate-binding protein [Melioribacteraceae bacterium]MCF8430699.1 phosphate ABC transporter substrate-binding protein [Melioribacteraceae bacterium]